MSTSEIAAILSVIGPTCRDSNRRQMLLESTTVNGIDYIEFDSPADGEFILHVHFVRQPPNDGFGLPDKISLIRVHGGTRITGIKVIEATVDGDVLDVKVDAQGDFSPYLLSVGWELGAGTWQYNFSPLDRPFSVAPVNFRPSCPVDFDCAPTGECAHDAPPEPELDYLARDYASFRQLLVDLVAQRNPDWTEDSPADIGTALLELIAYEGDQLAYMQDAVATEMYLDTARRRESAKHHARLIDYRMGDGANARTYVHFGVDEAINVPVDTRLLTGIDLPLQQSTAVTADPTSPPGTVITAIDDMAYTTDPALAHVRVFQTRNAVAAKPDQNILRIHTWGNDQCCLSRGQTTAHVYAIDPPPATDEPESLETATRHAIVPTLNAGDLLLVEELRGPETGSVADADPTHRQVVTITSVHKVTDPLFLTELDERWLPKKATTTTPTPTLELAEVTWAAHDALTFPLCLTTVLDGKTTVSGVSVARGNIAAAENGRTISERHLFDPPLGGAGIRLTLLQGPLTMVREFEEDPVHNADRFMKVEVTDVAGYRQKWEPRLDLLSSRDIDPHFVVDLDHRGRATLRFGDGEYGQSFANATAVNVTYRIGIGRTGNVGAEAIRHGLLGTNSAVRLVRNPLPAIGGVEPESIEEVRQFAPAAFRTQRRAVTAEDYRTAALSVPGVAGAVAAFRWTGSWYTALVGIDPADPADVLLDQPGGASLAPALRQRVLDVLNDYRLAGYDLEVRGATYVPLDVTLRICVKPGYFRGDVAHAVALALGGAQAGGRGLFNPDNFTFGQPVYLSKIYAVAEQVQGVDSVEATEFHRHGRAPASELEQGVITIGPWEIAQLDNDANRMENGRLLITTGGGS